MRQPFNASSHRLFMIVYRVVQHTSEVQARKAQSGRRHFKQSVLRINDSVWWQKGEKTMQCTGPLSWKAVLLDLLLCSGGTTRSIRWKWARGAVDHDEGVHVKWVLHWPLPCALKFDYSDFSDVVQECNFACLIYGWWDNWDLSWKGSGLSLT